MSWTRGRLLSTYTYDTNKTASFTYDHSGRRYSKTANGITKTYFYDNDKLIAESWSNGLQITYEYDILGIALMRVFKDGCDTVNLRFVTDALGNVIELRKIIYD